jgi:HlyD family secretion protein
MRMRTKVFIGVAVLVVAGGAVGAIIARSRNAGVQVRIEAVQKRNLESAVIASGSIRPHRRVDIQSDIMGRIIELRVREGQFVRKGDVLLRIDPTQYEAAVQRARAGVSESQSREAQVRANTLQAQRALERARQLAASGGLVTRQTLEEAETHEKVQKELLRAAEFNVEMARAALNEDLERLAKTVIRAPMDGIVTRLNVDEGETAIVGTMNNAGSLLLTVADLAVMEAVVRVDETDVPGLAVGDSAILQIDAFPGQKFVGRVTEIAHSSVRPPSQTSPTGSQAQAIDFEVVITLTDPPPDLRSDLSTTVDIITDTRKMVLSVPIIALAVREEKDVKEVPQEDPVASAAASAAAGKRSTDIEGVFVVREGKATFVPVKVGIHGREHFEVLSGVAEGDSVIAGPYEAIRTLANGTKIRPMTAANGEAVLRNGERR